MKSNRKTTTTNCNVISIIITQTKITRQLLRIIPLTFFNQSSFLLSCPVFSIFLYIPLFLHLASLFLPLWHFPTRPMSSTSTLYPLPGLPPTPFFPCPLPCSLISIRLSGHFDVPFSCPLPLFFPSHKSLSPSWLFFSSRVFFNACSLAFVLRFLCLSV